MKHLKLFILAGLTIMSCSDLTDDFSTDPVNITDPSVISTFKYLSGAQVNLIGAYEGDVNRLTGMWTGQFSGEDRQYVGLSHYTVSGRDFNSEWAAIYSSVLKNTQIIKRKARQENNARVLGIAQVMEAMSFGLAADLWGDVPFSEALQYPAIAQPKFDPQASVYQGVQRLLDSAKLNLAVTVANALVPSEADIFFGGDEALWTKTANTLKARYYLHVRDYANAIAFSDPAIAISSADEDMLATHGSAYLQTFNLFYSFITYDRAGYLGANSFAPRLLDPAEPSSRNNAKTDESARLNYIYFPGGGLNFSSIPYEANVLVDFDWGSGEDYDGFFGATTSFPMVSFAENMLIRAEAFVKNGDAASGLDALNTLRAYYNTGAHVNVGYATDYTYRYDPYVLADFAPGGMENSGNSQQDALLREILEEKYISLVGQLEVFNDVRRTKNILQLPTASGNPSIPKRLLYPQSEINTNSNVPQADLFQDTPVNSTAY